MKQMLAIVAGVAAAAIIVSARGSPAPVGTAFTYQGQLKQGGTAVNGLADLQLSLWDPTDPPTQVAPQIAVNNVSVTNGQFTVSVDFGVAPLGLNDNARSLGIAVRMPAGSGNFVTLSPRQPLTATPYALETRGISVNALSNVGIGTNAPNERLTVAGSMEIGTGSGDYQHLRIGGGNSDGFIYGSYPAFGDGIHLGYNYYANAAGANQIVHPDGGTSRISMGYGTIRLATAGPGGVPFDSMTISNGTTSFSNGYVGIGTASPSYPLHVRNLGFAVTAITGETSGGSSGAGVYGLATLTNGFATGVLGQCNSPSGWDFWAGGAGVNYGAPSSIRWKRNIELIDSPLEKIDQMRGVTFDWDAEHGGQHDVGFIGEEVGKVLPEVVVYEPDGQFVTGMDYSKVTPLLAEAIKALRAEKDAEIAALQQDNQQLRDRLAAVETAVARMIERKEQN